MVQPQDFLSIIKKRMQKKEITTYQLSKNFYVNNIISRRRLYDMMAGKAAPNFKVLEAVFFALDIEIKA